MRKDVTGGTEAHDSIRLRPDTICQALIEAELSRVIGGLPHECSSIRKRGCGASITGHPETAGAELRAGSWHPLYTYVGDTAPGMDKGNGLNVSGGVWHAIILSEKAAPAAASPKASSGGGGYGY